MNKPLITLMVLIAASGALRAQDEVAPRQIAPVEIRSKTNPGDWPYRAAYRALERLRALLPPAPRVIEPIFQMSFKEMRLEEQDAFLKPDWNVAVVGDSIDIVIPVIRGGYFLLRGDEANTAADAKVMFNSQTTRNFLRVAWQLPVGDRQTLSYDDFGKSFKEVAAVQDKIPWYSIQFRAEKRDRFNGLKACFADATGEVRVNGQAVPTIGSANCRIYQFEPSLAGTGAALSFVGPLDIVVLEDAGRYASFVANPES